MIPVDQTLFGGLEAVAAGDEPGDCLRAVVASIMERRLDEVPHFSDTGPTRPGNARVWAYALVGWLFTEGVVLWPFEISNPDLLPSAILPGYSILSGPGPRGHRHCVVGYQGFVVHDPHPSRDGLIEIDSLELLVPIGDRAHEVLSRAPEVDL